MLALASFRPSRIHLPALLPFRRFCFPPVSTAFVAPYRGIMRALTPAALTQIGRSLRLLRFAFRASHPHPRRAPRHRFDRHSSVSDDFQASPYPGRLAVQLRRIGFVSYGLLLRLLLLPTPPHGDAVTLDYVGCDFLRQGLPPCRQSVLTDAPGRRLRRLGSPPLTLCALCAQFHSFAGGAGRGAQRANAMNVREA